MRPDDGAALIEIQIEIAIEIESQESPKQA
jgi:hypothetical protein